MMTCAEKTDVRQVQGVLHDFPFALYEGVTDLRDLLPSYTWTDQIRDAADALLRGGYSLAVSVSANEACDAVAVLASRLRVRFRATYDAGRSVVILWMDERLQPDDVVPVPPGCDCTR